MNRTALTIRFPEEVLCLAREMKPKQVSLNEFVVDVLANSLRRRRGLKALKEMGRIREEIRAQTGDWPDLDRTIRDLREGVGRRD